MWMPVCAEAFVLRIPIVLDRKEKLDEGEGEPIERERERANRHREKQGKINRVS